MGDQRKKFSFRRVECKKISSHPGRYLLERMLKLSDARVKNQWIKREEKLLVPKSVTLNDRELCNDRSLASLH